ncbi:MAG: EpsI family protein [Kiritimatiellae bacterium]|nr:EpsI family protein [Kiritimatiellia bacterium]MCO5067935.1 EpsI family protein [Kiritimatiellia bacterium]
METRTIKPYITVIALLILTSLALAFTVNVNISDEAGVKVFLPDHVGEWTGDELRFCQAPACQKSWYLSQIKEEGKCPECGGQLGTMTKVEADLLPSDTEVLKKQYTLPSGQTLFASIVMSGRERASIHRPQVCLVGQGNEIVKSSVLDIPMDHRAPLDVMVLDMLRRWRLPDGRQGEYDSYYAYWFVGKGRETPYHTMRMVLMASDRIFHNRSHRWAYISVSGDRDKAGTYRAEIKDFVRQLYPEIVLE